MPNGYLRHVNINILPGGIAIQTSELLNIHTPSGYLGTVTRTVAVENRRQVTILVFTKILAAFQNLTLKFA